jgi:cellulose synthase/poly-beta-1,6-N-acetylglucosamine synthase-like glycosyltransferase
MGSRRAQKLILIPWLSLPAVLFSHLALWGRMPPDIAVHFTSSGGPVTLLSQAGFLLFSVGTLLAVLLACTWRLRNPAGRDATGTLLRYYFAVAVMVFIYFGVLIYNVASRA